MCFDFEDNIDQFRHRREGLLRRDQRERLPLPNVTIPKTDFATTITQTTVADIPKTTYTVKTLTKDWANNPAETDFQTNDTSLGRDSQRKTLFGLTHGLYDFWDSRQRHIGTCTCDLRGLRLAYGMHIHSTLRLCTKLG